MPLVLGLSGYFHDAAACLVDESGIVAAAQEESESRVKHDASFPARAARRCLEIAGRAVEDLDLVVHYELPELHAERVLHSALRFAPRSFRAFPKVVRGLLDGKLWVEQAIGEELGYAGPVLFVPHHLSHAASAYLPSPFDDAAALTLDGVGEWATTMIARGRACALDPIVEQHFPHSLGLFYATITAWCGFRVGSGEYKLMGLAPYGAPIFADRLRTDVIRVRDDGTLRLNLRHFSFTAGTGMGAPSLAAILGGPPRAADAPLTQREADLAASAQRVTEEAMVTLARAAQARTGARALCLAGGVALNGVGVQRILDAGLFAGAFVQPAAGDAGGALGAALLGMRELAPGWRPPRTEGGDAMRGALLGRAWSDAEIEAELSRAGMAYARLAPAALDRAVAAALASGSVAGWFQGRMEFGPRALGSRSILADPRSAETHARVNREMKLREAFRPFAPSVLAEHARAWFVLDGDAPYMTRVVPARGFEGVERVPPKDGALVPWRVRAPLAAVTHVDGSSRVQTVSAATLPRFHALLTAFHDATGVPALLNTSFNLRGEPLVSSPLDALRTFAHSGLDLLAIGSYLVRRDAQAPNALARIEAPRRVDD